MGLTGIFAPDESLNLVNQYGTVFNSYIGLSNEMIEYLSQNKILFTDAYYRIDNIHLFEEESINSNSITSDIGYDTSFNLVDISSNVVGDVYGVKDLIEITVNVYDKYYNFSQDKTRKIDRDYKGSLYFYKKLDKSSVNNLWQECYNYIKPLIVKSLDNIINQNEVLKSLDLSSTLIDN